MDRPTAEVSIAESGEGVTDPGSVKPIADLDGREATAAGFEFSGREYGPEAWIVCDMDGLKTVEM